MVINNKKFQGPPMAIEDFFKLCESGTFKEVQAAIRTGVNVNSRNEYGVTPLMFAVEHNEDREVVKILINAGADVNAEDESNKTPLMYASEYCKNEKIVKLLLRSRAEINARNKYGEISLMYGVWNENSEVTK
ncbi:MAG: ankyrin repeat domain-containing protein, partial [Spirochaetales bacterium]|nr:ankyrin repeat domain-containing protein [Spirochaetales bacterium]